MTDHDTITKAWWVQALARKNMKPIKQSPDSSPMICILGATATGKTRLGVALAQQFNGEIISADSRQVYRGLDIGSGKDLQEYGATAYHLIDIVSPGHEFNVFEFVQHYNGALKAIEQNQTTPFLVGGTGMYLDAILSRYELTVRDETRSQSLKQMSDTELKAVLHSLNPTLHNSTDTVDRTRIISAIEIASAQRSGAPVIQANKQNTLILGISMPRETIRQRITQRLKERLQQGMIEEVEQLHSQGVSWKQLHFYGLEYRYIAQHLQGELSYNDMYQKLNSAIHQFAKQQEKWFRNIAKKGHTIEWLAADDDLINKASKAIQRFNS